MATYLTQTELDAINASALTRDTVFAIRDVSMGYFSIASYYGGATFNGKRYTYFPDTDELIRDDVLAFVAKLRKPPKKRKPTAKKEPLFAEDGPNERT